MERTPITGITLWLKRNTNRRLNTNSPETAGDNPLVRIRKVLIANYGNRVLKKGIQKRQPILQQVILSHIVRFEIRADTDIFNYIGNGVVGGNNGFAANLQCQSHTSKPLGVWSGVE